MAIFFAKVGYGAALMAFLAGCVENSSDATGTTTTPTVSSYRLNDTGVTVHLNDTAFPARALGTTAPTPDTTTTSPSTLPGQDAAYGNDADSSQTSTDGANGYKFTKLDNTGLPLSNQSVTYGTTPWSCVYDNVTGLTWEVKTTSGMQYYNHRYTWYNSNNATNGGNAGSIGDTTTCTGITYCNTEEFIKAINTQRLCGYDNWRLPTREELRSLVDYSKASTGLMIDENFFPNTMATDHWAAETAYYADSQNASAWEVHFNEGYSEGHPKSSQNVVVRLVRSP